MLAIFYSWICKSYLYLGPLLAFLKGWWWCCWCFWLELDHWLLVLGLLLPVACPAPPCAWLPTLPALHLPGAWLAPCCSWSWLSNHVALALAMGFDWWGEFPLDAQLMSRENLCCGAGAVCYGAGAVGAVVLWVLWCCGCWSTRVSLLTSFALAELFYTTPLVSIGLTPLAMHLVTSCLLAWWLGRPDWFKADICVWVMLIRSSFWWLSTVLLLILTATCITMVAFLFVFSFVCRW
jgi:hypothetical protein